MNTFLLRRTNRVGPSNTKSLKSYLLRRSAHGNAPHTPIPLPTPFVPDPATFLSLIGRGLSQHASKISDWRSLFTLTSEQMRQLGIEPARSRRYLIWWRDRFQRGLFGVGGDLTNVENGRAELRIVEVPQNDAPVAKQPKPGPASAPPTRLKRMVVNETEKSLSSKTALQDLRPVAGVQIGGAGMINGAWTSHVKGTRGRVAVISRHEGMWEVRRGHKVDGGERRRKEVRRRRLLEQSQTTRPS